MSTKSPFELSFILNDEIQRCRFFAEPSLVEGVLKRLHSAVQMEMVNSSHFSASEFQILPLGVEHSGTAKHLVETIAEALGIELGNSQEENDQDDDSWARWKKLEACAVKIDEFSEKIPEEKREYWSVEFIWDNGGGDDNAFGQGFLMDPNRPQSFQRFCEALEDIENEEGPFYDVCWESQSMMEDAMSLPELEALVAPLGVPSFHQAISSLITSLRAEELENTLPPAEEAPPSKPRGPRF